MENIVLKNLVYKIVNNSMFDTNNNAVYNLNGNKVNDLNGNHVFNVINNFIVDLYDNLIYVIKDDNVYDITTTSQYTVINGQVLDSDGNVIPTTQSVTTNGDITVTTYVGTDDDTTINVVDTEFKTNNVEISDIDKTIVNQYDDDTETSNILAQINDYASKIEISDFQNKCRIEDYLSLIQNAQNIVNQNKVLNVNVDLAQYNNLGNVADELSDLFNQLSTNVQLETTVLDKEFLNGLLSTMQKLYRLSNAFGKFKEVMSSEIVVNIPKSLSTIGTTLQRVSDTLTSASNYITYFADSSSVTDLNIISQSQLSASDLANIQESIDLISSSSNTMNNLVEETVSTITTNINTLSSNITGLSNSLNKLKLKIGTN